MRLASWLPLAFEVLVWARHRDNLETVQAFGERLQRRRFNRGVQRIERLALGVDPDVRVVLQHPARQVAADGFQHVVGHTHLGGLGDDRGPQIVEPEPAQASGVAQCAPSGVPLQHRLRRVIPSPLARRPEIVVCVGVPKQVRTLEHPRGRPET